MKMEKWKKKVEEMHKTADARVYYKLFYKNLT